MIYPNSTPQKPRRICIENGSTNEFLTLSWGYGTIKCIFYLLLAY
jgi:hypothetical protein